LINDYRSKNGLGALTISLTLGAAAEFHSVDMAKNNYFSHTLYDGTTWKTNIANHGYPTNSYRAENIAAGYESAIKTFEQWRTSSGHNANMLSSRFNAIGIGRAYSSNSHWGYYWTTTFGSVVDTSYSCGGGSTSGGEKPGTQLSIVGGGRTASSTPSTRAYDGKTSTAWYTTSTSAPRAAYVFFDLGSTKQISKISWYFSKNGSADSFEVQVSTDKKNWTTITKRTTAKAGNWVSAKKSTEARYVRFYFKNPNKDKVLGYLAEVKVYA
jgi:hypothetical protein